MDWGDYGDYALPRKTHTQKCIRSGEYHCVCKEGLSDFEMAALVAEDKGCFIVEPKPNELFIDIDTSEQLARFHKRFNTKWLFDSWGCRFKIAPSPSGKENHFHIVVTLSFNVSKFYRIFLQWLLGSDPKREWLSFRRWLVGARCPTLFFERIQNAGPFRSGASHGSVDS